MKLFLCVVLYLLMTGRTLDASPTSNGDSSLQTRATCDAATLKDPCYLSMQQLFPQQRRQSGLHRRGMYQALVPPKGMRLYCLELVMVYNACCERAGLLDEMSDGQSAL
ncbi:hypothetical protein B0I35DRAFT_414894 [Stachybotrys elegans]|uniref:Uncharacterized protein n=1 Tax=Stachybotrys elegans TaxID=80388 RepID=A0A8K0SDS1_9HYPO|nr:hypothetical protein B0I35DRAFT_414894 [Stachybotrys elegans]